MPQEKCWSEARPLGRWILTTSDGVCTGPEAGSKRRSEIVEKPVRMWHILAGSPCESWEWRKGRGGGVAPVLWALGRFHSRDCSECVCERWLRLCEDEQEQWVWVVGGPGCPSWTGGEGPEPGGGHGGGNGLLRRDGGESPREQVTAKGWGAGEWQDWTHVLGSRFWWRLCRMKGGQRTSRRGKPPEELALTPWAPDIRVNGEEVAVSRLLEGSDGPLDVAAEGLALWVSVCRTPPPNAPFYSHP